MTLIIIDPNIKGGLPVINGTRIPVKTLVYLNRNLNKSPEEIVTKYYTQLSVDQVIEVLKWFDNIEQYGWMDFR